MKIKKEATVAVIIGLVLALVVTGGVLRARTALQSIKLPTRESVGNSKLPTPETKTTELFLDLTTPDNSVSTEPKFVLSGKTLPSTYIAILGEKGEYLIVPNDLGVFSQEITLVKGQYYQNQRYQNDGNKSRALSTQCTRPPSCDRYIFTFIYAEKLLLFLSLALFIIHNSSFITRAVHADRHRQSQKRCRKAFPHLSPLQPL